MTTIYFDCFSGAAGDMILGALIDAGVPVETVRERLGGLKLEGWELRTREVARGPLRATKAEVVLGDSSGTRRYTDIDELIRRAELPERAKAWALDAFLRLARAEANVHGTSIEEVRLHEVGALDAIVDIVGSCVALDELDPDEVIASPVATGRGLIDSAHGPLPIPAPAVVEIALGVNMPLVERGENELVTPTGAAILAATAARFGPIPEITPSAVGYGAGDARREVPNVVRVLVGDDAEPPLADTSSLLIETNIDDMSPEFVPHVLDALLHAGAQDAWVTPITMKKGRPAMTLSVLTDPTYRWHIFEILFRETTTLGVRITDVEREILERDWIEVDVEGSPVRVKLGKRAEDIVTIAPEHDDASKAARATGLPLKEVYALAIEAARDLTEPEL